MCHMWTLWRRRLACLAWLTVLMAMPIGMARAELVQDLDTPIAVGSALSYRQLVDRVFPGSGKAGGQGEVSTVAEKVLRRLGTRQRTVLSEGTRLTGFEVQRVRGDGRRYLVLRWDAEPPDGDMGASVVAVFPEGSAEPQDVADVQDDRFSSFGSRALLPLGPDDGFTVLNAHHNSNQGYLETLLFHIHEGRLRQIATVFTLRVRGACEHSFDEALAWRTVPEAGTVYPKVVATVTLTRGPDKEESEGCPTRTRKRTQETFSGSWRWDKAKQRYVADGSTQSLERLQKFNQKSF